MSLFTKIEVNHLSFNQEYSCIAIGLRNGFSIYNLDPIELRYNLIGEGMGKIEMLYCTSLLALVGSGEQSGSSPRKFKLWNSQNQELICELSFPSTILNIKFNRERVVICLENQIHVYELSTMKCLQVLSISSNPSGLIALSSEKSSYLAFPTGSLGGVVLYDCLSLRLVSQIDAHKNNVVALTFNSNGTILATASVSGTVIRLFNIPTGNHLCTFRRGSRPAEIHYLSFSNDSALLAASSSNGTVHIFDVASVIYKLSHPTELTPSTTLSSSTSTTLSSLPNSTNKQSKSRSQSIDSNGSSNNNNNSNNNGDNWTNSWTNSALTYLSMAQSWGMSAVSGLNVLPEPLQEYADSIRAVAVARVPSTALQSDGIHTSGMYVASIIESIDNNNINNNDDNIDNLLQENNNNNIKNNNHPHEKSYKIVVVTKTKQLFRFNVPSNIQELTMLQKNGEESTMIQCILEDEAILE